jgi:hypothetical protein
MNSHFQDEFFYKVTASLAPHVVQGGRLDANNLQGIKLVGAVKSVEGKIFFPLNILCFFF